MADYSTTITIGGGSGAANTGNPTYDWNTDNRAYELQYTHAYLKVGPSHYVGLTGLRVLEGNVTGFVGEMPVDQVWVHVHNTVGALVEFWYGGEIQASVGLVNGVANEYIPAAKMTVALALQWD